MKKRTLLTFSLSLLLLLSCEDPVTENSSQKKVEPTANPLLGIWGNKVRGEGGAFYYGYHFADSVVTITEATDSTNIYSESLPYSYTDSTIVSDDTVIYRISNDTLYFGDEPPLIKDITLSDIDLSENQHPFKESDLYQHALKDRNGNIWSFGTASGVWGDATYYKQYSNGVLEQGTWSCNGNIVTLTNNQVFSDTYTAYWKGIAIVLEMDNGYSIELIPKNAEFPTL